MPPKGAIGWKTSEGYVTVIRPISASVGPPMRTGSGTRGDRAGQRAKEPGRAMTASSLTFYIVANRSCRHDKTKTFFKM